MLFVLSRLEVPPLRSPDKNTPLPNVQIECAHGCNLDISLVLIFFELYIDPETTQSKEHNFSLLWKTHLQGGSATPADGDSLSLNIKSFKSQFP